MGSTFASIHFLNTDKINEDYVELIKPHIQPPIVLAFLNLPDPEIFGVASNNVFSLFSEDFSMETIDKIVCKSYKGMKMPTIVTAGILDSDVVTLSIIQNSAVVANITLKPDEDNYGAYEEFPERYENTELFEKLFGVTLQQLKEATDEDAIDTLDNWAKLIGVPFNHSHYSAKIEFANADSKDFIVGKPAKPAKIIAFDEIKKLLEDAIGNISSDDSGDDQ